MAKNAIKVTKYFTNFNNVCDMELLTLIVATFYDKGL